MRRTRSTRLAIAAALTAACASSPAWAQLAAFPGAQGFGEDTTGGRTGSVYVVTNLNDSGAGSFRDAVSQSNRIIVFAVSGYIDLLSAVSCSSNLTILGQTAPGEGIGFMGHEVSFSDESNAVIQYLRFREGSSDSSAKASLNLGDLNGGIVDHVSAEFSQYDNIDAVGANSAADNITYQNDLVADPIKSQQLNLHEEGNQTTYLNNIFANNHGRNPLAKSNSQYVDNVNYDYGYAFTTGNSMGKFDYDIINNYFIAGPSTTSAADAFYQLDNNQSAFASGNLLDGNKNGALDGSTVTPESNGNTINALSSEYSPETQFLPTLSASAAFSFDTVHAGDSLQYDQVDSQIISQVESLGATGSIYNEQADDGLSNSGFGTIPTGTVSFVSSAGDDIPDTWATTHGLNPASLAGATLKNALGYDMIEQYAQQLGDEYASQTWTNTSGEWTGGTWAGVTPGIYDHALIRGGGAVTISTGDNASAFSVNIGGNGGESLNVTGGSLALQDTIYVGDLSNAAFNMTGGVVRADNVQLGNTVWDSNGHPTSYTGTFNFNGGTLQVGQIVMGAGAPGNWTGGTNWLWNGGTVQAFPNLNINSPATLGSGGAFVSTVGPDGVTYTGLISGVLSGTGSFTKLSAGSLVLSASNTYTGSTTVSGGILSITGSIAANGSNSVFIAADSTGNTQFIRKTPAGASYDGFGSSVLSGLQSHADIVQGMNSTNNSSGENINMRWQLRTSAETPTGPGALGLVSEIITLTGMANTGTTGAGQTDPFALQMSFSPSYFTSSATEKSAALNSQIHLASQNGSAWVDTTTENFGSGAHVFSDVQSSWLAFASANGVTDSNIGTYLGSWGVDVTNNEMWAVVNHNSNFAVDVTAVVPEPAAPAVLLAMSAGALARRRRRAHDKA